VIRRQAIHRKCFISTAHSDADLDQTLVSAEKVFKVTRNN